MPIPLLIWGVVAAACAFSGGVAYVSAKERIKEAQQKYADRRRRYEEAVRRYEEKYACVASRFEDLGKTRLEATVILGKAVKFLDRAKLKDRELFEKFNITPEQRVQFRKASVSARDILAGGASALGSGAATAAAAYGLVTTLASASTGTAIATLSGAAAKSATLAWLGGGTLAAGGGGVAAGTVVLGGFVVGPAILVIGLWGLKQAGDVENQVEKGIAELDIDEAEKRKGVAALDAVLARVTELKESTIKLKNELEDLLSYPKRVWRAIKTLTRLSSSSPDNDHDAYRVAKVAASLGQLLDIAILDNDGRII